MKRHEWEFTTTGFKLVEACAKKVEHHKQRLAWWNQKNDEVRAKLPNSVEIHDSVAAEYSASNLGYGPQVQIDPAIARDLNEVTGKIKQHASRIREFENWIAILSADEAAQYKLHSDDWLFFFGE